jgi:hypothetical protein
MQPCHTARHHGTACSQDWTLTAANAIGESGYMVGNGVPKAWILYPQCQE